jgi:branched-chain amino acid transport system substrate-binding protein
MINSRSAIPRWSCALALLLLSTQSFAQAPAAAPAAEQKPFKLGVVTFLSGAAAGPFGVPARNGAEVLVEALNAAKVPGAYGHKGLGGRSIELVFLDEAGGTTKQVSEYRDLVQRQNVDAVIGYISSGDCLAVAPVSEELKKLTILFDCGTPRIFEDGSYKYLFRTTAPSTMDNVAAALYVTEMLPGARKYAGINQNYAWGQDSWSDFEASMKVLRPSSEVTTSQMPKLGAGQYGAEVSAIMSGSPDVIHSSFWGGDLDAFVLQASPRGAFKKATAVLTCGETATHKLAGQIPDGTIIGARGPHGAFAPDVELNRWFRAAYQERFILSPNYPAYHMAQAILGLKSAYEKAQGTGAEAPSQEQIAAAFAGSSFETPSGTIKMALGKGHQAVEETVYGQAKTVNGKLTFVNVKRYPAEKVNPPEGVKSADWIKASLKPGK